MIISYDVREYGAVGDGVSYDTVAFQSAIDACAAAGGGTVYIPPGRYVCAPMTLASFVTLHLEAGATVLASPRPGDYTPEPEQWEPEWLNIGLITARHAQCVTITGRGTLDGNGMAFIDTGRVKLNDELDSDFARRFTRQGDDFLHERFDNGEAPYHAPPTDKRPGTLVRFHDCQNVEVSGVTLANSPVWTMFFHECIGVHVTGLHIHSPASERRMPNDDGVDFLNCRGVRLSDCFIETGDDCIAVFGGEDMVFSNCTLWSRSAGVRVGWLHGGAKRLAFSNLIIHSNRGVGIFLRAGFDIEQISFTNLIIKARLHIGHWWGNGEAIHISAVRREPGNAPLGRIRGLRFAHITAEAENGIVVYGTPERSIEDLVLEDVTLTMQTSPVQTARGGNFDLRGVASLEQGIFTHDIPALYAQYVEGLHVRGLHVRWADDLPEYYT
ncbi:MAG TPA: glycosyl hydrolase family 28 protein, partial [Candidatus Limnocylindrales bacterium]|nr:glycosyl hydrolase family 28 protein [Candidatus Limnocylindrales bacterium]